jgi:hypothetical protein
MPITATHTLTLTAVRTTTETLFSIPMTVKLRKGIFASNQMPSYVTDNKFVKDGYRFNYSSCDCVSESWIFTILTLRTEPNHYTLFQVASLGSLHNQTFNAWSSMMGFVLFFVMGISVYEADFIADKDKVRKIK